VSSTRKRKRKGEDNYPTPRWAVNRFLERAGLTLPGGRWIEPSVGEGVIVDAVNAYVPGIEWTICDVRDVRPRLQRFRGATVHIEDFLKFSPSAFGAEFDVAIMNPPFSDCVGFIEECRRIARTVICFQSLNLLGSADRNKLVKGAVPDVYVLPDRVSHSGDGKTDSVYAAWYVWGESVGRVGSIQVLDTTDLRDRNADSYRVRESLDGERLALDSLFFEVRGIPWADHGEAEGA
jgi:hypothetical protein